MSTIGAVGGTSTNLLSLYQLLQQNRVNSSSAAQAKATDADGDNDGSKAGETSDAAPNKSASSPNTIDLIA